ncbi:hypothetical protein PV10_07224 [Exophiala mesophila]|uniref:Uncharacterized protein n=1 Tax=Exophiala mesophila TaxID=212818 RepID=A0A0D1XP16_EXOME|nr:uncharacterized protein PV10_07224 [Exophiala mesophila]KIV89856.1 hypothetical protein PV10_07224 [Exophiala mesophila]
MSSPPDDQATPGALVHELLIAIDPHNKNVFSHLIPSIVSDLYHRIEELSSKSVVETKKAEARKKLMARFYNHKNNYAERESGKRLTSTGQTELVSKTDNSNHAVSRKIQEPKREKEKEKQKDTERDVDVDIDQVCSNLDRKHGHGNEYEHEHGHPHSHPRKRRPGVFHYIDYDYDYDYDPEPGEEGKGNIPKKQRRQDQNGNVKESTNSFYPVGGLVHRFKSKMQEKPVPLQNHHHLQSMPVSTTETATAQTKKSTSSSSNSQHNQSNKHDHHGHQNATPSTLQTPPNGLTKPRPYLYPYPYLKSNVWKKPKDETDPTISTASTIAAPSSAILPPQFYKNRVSAASKISIGKQTKYSPTEDKDKENNNTNASVVPVIAAPSSTATVTIMTPSPAPHATTTTTTIEEKMAKTEELVEVSHRSSGRYFNSLPDELVLEAKQWCEEWVGKKDDCGSKDSASGAGGEDADWEFA